MCGEDITFMMRTVVYEKAGRLRCEREVQVGANRWQTVTRLVFRTVADLVQHWPHGWTGGTARVQVVEPGTAEWQQLRWACYTAPEDNLLCEPHEAVL